VVDASPARDAILSQGAGSGTTDGNREWRLALVVVVASGVVRLFIAALTPVFPDETYYWEWSRRLAAGYYDHPPMIAWLIKFGALAAGDTALGVRLGAVLAGVAATFFTAAAARRLAGDRAALIAAMVLAVMPLSAAGLILATPDAPLLAAAAATVYAHENRHDGGASPDSPWGWRSALRSPLSCSHWPCSWRWSLAPRCASA